MYGNDDDKKTKKKPGFNAQAFKHAISMIESSGGKFLDNKSSSAAGKYHFLYNSIKNDPSMDGVSKREFMNRPELQESIMDKALSGELDGYSYGQKYANKLIGEYESDYDVNEVSALVHFLGPSNTRKFLKDPTSFKVPGRNNATGQEYVKRFGEQFNQYNLDNSQPKPQSEQRAQSPSYTSPRENEERNLMQPIDNTRVVKPISRRRDIEESMRVPQNPSEMIYNLDLNGTNNDASQPRMEMNDIMLPPESSKKDLLSFLDDPKEVNNNNFKDGGNITGVRAEEGASELVTMFEAGGSHKASPHGGIPLGMGANGKPNLVEEGETKWNNYIFSNAYDMEGNYTGDDGKKSNVFEKGGMIKRADGSSSKRGLWDNIRANKGSGKKPTADMLKQEREINSKKEGGSLIDPTDPPASKVSVLNKSDASKNVLSFLDNEYFLSPQKQKDKKELKLTKQNHPTRPSITEEHAVPNVRDNYRSQQYPLKNPVLGKVDFKSLTNDGSQSFLDRYNNPVTRDRMKSQSGVSDEDIDNMIIKGLSAEKQIGGNNRGSKASYYDDKISMGKDYANDTSVESHERVHASNIDAAMGLPLMDVLGNAFNQEGMEYMKKNDPKVVEYMNQPHEAYGNFNEFREKLGVKPGQQLTKEKLKNLVKAKGLEMENFYRVFNDDNIVKALNTIAHQDKKSSNNQEYKIS